MDIDFNMIVNAIVAILTAGGVYGGAKYGYNRIQAARQAAAEREAQAAGFGPVNTGQIPAVVTSDQCSNTRNGIMDSIHEVRTEVKDGLERQSGQLTKLSETVGEIKEKLAGQEGAMIKAVGYGVREHERRYHGTRSTGNYPKAGGS